jgi:hypothetical protein
MDLKNVVMQHNMKTGPNPNNPVTGGAHLPFKCTPPSITGKYAGFGLRSLSCTQNSYADETALGSVTGYENEYSTMQQETA